MIENVTRTNLRLSQETSLALSRRLLDLKEIGIHLTKEKLISLYVKQGLQNDQVGPSEPWPRKK